MYVVNKKAFSLASAARGKPVAMETIYVTFCVQTPVVT
jgi:hypothetical protein